MRVLFTVLAIFAGLWALETRPQAAAGAGAIPAQPYEARIVKVLNQVEQADCLVRPIDV